MRKKLLLTLTMALVLTATSPLVVTDKSIMHTSSNPETVLRKDIIDYQYTVINNVLYKRLYNYTQNKPVSDWVIA